MEQSAVEWLLYDLQIKLLIIKSEPDGIVRETMINNFLIDTSQAKEIEKQQIINALHYFGIENAEQYYNEQFNK